MINMEHASPELLTAYAKAQAEVENASKNSTNPHFKSKYADLAEILNTVRPVFTNVGLSLIQSTEYDGNLVSVTTVVAHPTGYISSVASCAVAKNDAQEIGKATTYLRRYSLASMTGIAQEDTDAEPATRAPAPTPIDFISKDQASEILDLLKQTNSDVPRFLKLFMIKNVADMKVTQYDGAKAMLAKKMKSEEKNNGAE
jgi:hypothetical protein